MSTDTNRHQTVKNGMFNNEKIYISGVSRMVTVKRTQNKIYITGYYKRAGEWSFSWIVETSDIMEFGIEEF